MVEISSSASFYAIKWWLPSTPTCHRRTRVGDDTSDPPTHHPQTDTTSPSPFLVHLKKKKMKGENQDIFRTSIFLSPPPTSGFSLFATYLSLLPPPSHFSLFLLVALFFFFLSLISLCVPTPPLFPAEKEHRRNGSLLLLLNQRRLCHQQD